MSKTKWWNHFKIHRAEEYDKSFAGWTHVESTVSGEVEASKVVRQHAVTGVCWPRDIKYEYMNNYTNMIC